MFTWEININAIYDQFSKIIAPKIAEWFVMTKDWFMDLSSRYIQYSIRYEWIWIIVFIFMAIVASIIVNIIRKNCNEKIAEADRWDRDDWSITKHISIIVYWFFMVGLFIATVNTALSLVKWKFVPEIQLYKEIVNINWDWQDPISK